jgi:hypothetical protein
MRLGRRQDAQTSERQKRAPEESKARRRHHTIDRRKLPHVRDQRSEICVCEEREHFARHHDQRRAVAADAIADRANEVGVRHRGGDPTAPAREVRAGDDADHAHVGVDETAAVRSVAGGAGADGFEEMLSARERGGTGGNRDGVLRDQIALRERALAEHVDRADDRDDEDGQSNREAPHRRIIVQPGAP